MQWRAHCTVRMSFTNNNFNQPHQLHIPYQQSQSATQFPTMQYQQSHFHNETQLLNFPPQVINQNLSSFNSQAKASKPAIMQRSISSESVIYDSNDGYSQEDEPASSSHDWQRVKKRKRSNKNTPDNESNQPVQTGNKFEPLSNLNQNDQTTREPNPPPIFIYGVTDFNKMIDNLSQITEEETYQCKALQNDTIKINTKNPDIYRKLVRHLNSEKIVHHTYQMKQERAYRVVIRNLHYSIPVENIKKEIENKGHTVRNILNIRHRVSKQPLMMFYVDLEPKPNNKEVYKIEFLNHMKISIEPPHKKKVTIQCTRCQSYGHSKSYCTRPYNCVKCGGGHNSQDCRKPRNTPAKCALCSRDHTANYKGCTVYRDLQNIRNKQRNVNRQPSQVNPQSRNMNNIITNNNQPENSNTQSYAEAAKGANNRSTTDIGAQLNAFFSEFKTMFMQLINQNSMILNMLSTVINNKTSNGH